MRVTSRVKPALALAAFVSFALVRLALSAGFDSAQPVWPTGRETERNLFVGFRATIDGSAATLRYSASSIARVWLNGRFLAYGPARGPHGLDRIDEIPLAGLVTNGVNTLAFEVAGYNVDSFYLLNEPAYLAAEVLDGAGRILAATAPQGAVESFVLTERVQKVPRFSYQRPFCEVYALTPTSTAWRTGAPRTPRAELAAVAGSPWTDRVFPYPDYTVSTDFRPLKGGRLVRRVPARFHPGRSVTGESDPTRGYAEAEIAIQPVREIQSLPSVDARPVDPSSASAFTAKSYVLFDHGLNDTGFLGARVVCRMPGRVYFYFDEVLKGGDIDVARMGWQCVNALAYDFTEPGEYRIEAFEPNTFRYLKVMSDTFEGEISDLFVRAYKNGEAKTATFRSTDSAFDRIFDAAKETFVQNAVDAFTDCPSRERAGWLCDSFFSGRTAALLTGNTSVEKGFLENYAKCPKTLEGGFLPMCYPADAGLLPNWNLWLILELEEYLARSGDRALVDEMKPKVLGIIAAFRRFRNSDGLLEKLPGWVFIEWSRANELVQDVSYPTNMTYAEVLDAVARLYGLPEYAAEAARVRETVRRQSWTGEWFCDNAVRQMDGSLRLSGECTETCQYYAFFFKTAMPETHPELWQRLVTDFGPQRRTTKKHPQIHFANAFIGNYLRLELLSRAGRAQQILDETKGYFLGMAEKTGTLWEHDNVSNSCNHGFASHVALMLVRDVLGMSVDPHTAKVTYRPTDAELQGGAVTLPTEKGPLEFVWCKGGRVEYGKPMVIDFGASGARGIPAVVVAAVDGYDVKIRLSASVHPEESAESGDVFTVSRPGTVRMAEIPKRICTLRLAVETPGAVIDVNKVVLEN